MKRYELDGIIKRMMAEAYYKGAVEGSDLDKEDPDFRDIVKDAWNDLEEDIFEDYEDEIRDALDEIIMDETNEDADENESIAEEEDPEEKPISRIKCSTSYGLRSAWEQAQEERERAIKEGRVLKLKYIENEE